MISQQNVEVSGSIEIKCWWIILSETGSRFLLHLGSRKSDNCPDCENCDNPGYKKPVPLIPKYFPVQRSGDKKIKKERQPCMYADELSDKDTVNSRHACCLLVKRSSNTRRGFVDIFPRYRSNICSCLRRCGGINRQKCCSTETNSSSRSPVNNTTTYCVQTPQCHGCDLPNLTLPDTSFYLHKIFLFANKDLSVCTHHCFKWYTNTV